MARKKVEFDITAEDKTKATFLAVNKSLGALKKAGKAAVVPVLAGAAVIGGLTKLTLEAVKTGDAVAKAADAIGISTDALQEYRFAADLAGIGTEKFDASLKKFSRTFGELRAGTGTAVTFLNKYDKDLLRALQSTQSMDQALDLVARAMANAATQSDAAALAAAFFGRSGVDMTNIVKGGTEALDAQRQKARDLGLVLEEDLLRGAEKVNDQLTILTTTIGANLNRALLEVAPQLGELAARFTEAIPDIVKWVDKFGQFIGLIDQSKPERLAEIADEIAEIDEKLGSFTYKLLEFDITGKKGPLAQKLEELKKEKAEIEAAIKAEVNAGLVKTPAAPVPRSSGSSSAPVLGTSISAETELLKEAKAETAALVDEINGALEAESKWAELSEEAAIKRRMSNQAVTEYLAALKENNQVLALESEGKQDQADALRQEIDLRNQIGRELLPAERAELEKLTAEQNELNEKIGESGEKWSAMEDIGLGAIQSLEDGFEGLARFALQNIDKIIRGLVEMNNTATGSSGSGSSLLGTLFGAAVSSFGGGASYGAGSTGIASGGFDYIPAFATGGSFMVGGRGGTDNNVIPIRASLGERVTVETPAQQRAAQAPANNNTFHVTIGPGASVEAVRELEAFVRRVDGSIETRAVAATSDGLNRGKIRVPAR